MKYRLETLPDKTRISRALSLTSTPQKQAGVSIVGAIFLITGLAVLGTLLTRLTTVGNSEVINEWYSAQALYSAESGIDWAAYNILHGGTGSAANSTVHANRSWFTTAVSATAIGGRNLYIINSTGTAGTTSSSPIVQREIEVQFLP